MRAPRRRRPRARAQRCRARVGAPRRRAAGAPGAWRARRAVPARRETPRARAASRATSAPRTRRRRRRSCRARGLRSSPPCGVGVAEDEDAVVAAEAERIAERDAHRRGLAADAQLRPADRIEDARVDGARPEAVLDREQARNRLDDAGGAERVAGDAL